MNEKITKQISYVFKVAKWQFIYKTLTSVIIRGILLAIPIVLSKSIDLVASSNYNEAIRYFILMIVIFAVYKLFEILNQDSYYVLYNKLYKHFNELALNKTKNNSLYSLSRFSLGEYTNIIISDVDVISTFYASLIIRTVQVVEFIFIFIYFYSINFYIFISALALTVIMYFVSNKCNKKVQDLNVKRKDSLDLMTSSIHEFFQGIKEIKSFNISKRLIDINTNKAGNYLNNNKKYIIKYFTNNSLILFAFELFRILSVIFAVYLCSIGKQEVGILLLIYNYYQKIIDNFSVILTFNVEIKNLNVSVNRFDKLIIYSKDKADEVLSFVDGNIEFKDVLYGFKENPTLNKKSFIIPKNSISVLTGRDESAQNGVFDLLLKLNRQHEGNIFIDEVDISQINDEEYFKMISLSRRPSFFFNMSIKENLLMFSESEEQMISLCKDLGIYDDVMKLSNGFDTILKHDTPLKDYTKEMLSVCRMLLKNSKILLFDDTISNIDKNTQKKMFDIINELKINHTIIIISNDEYIIKKADKVIEFN